MYWLLQLAEKSNELEHTGGGPLAPLLPAFKSGKYPAKAAVDKIIKAMIKIVRMIRSRYIEHQRT